MAYRPPPLRARSSGDRVNKRRERQTKKQLIGYASSSFRISAARFDPKNAPRHSRAAILPDITNAFIAGMNIKKR
jgi:hypothetical protein